jgi:hypothetical protein
MVWNDPPKILELEVCQLNKFGERYRDIFKDKHLDKLYCLKDVSQITLEGYSHLDTYNIDDGSFWSEDAMYAYIKHDLKLIAGGGYNTDHIYDVRFEFTR